MDNTKNPGKILQLADGRLAICYNRQPVMGRLIFHLVNDKYEHILDENKRPKLLIKKLPADVTGMRVIGFVD